LKKFENINKKPKKKKKKKKKKGGEFELTIHFYNINNTFGFSFTP